MSVAMDNWLFSYMIGAGALLVSSLTLLIGLVFSGRERRITVAGEATSGGLATLVVPLFILLSGGRLVIWLALPAVFLGLAAGAGCGFMLPLRLTVGGAACGRHSRLLLLLWGGALLLAQLAVFSGVGLLLTLSLLALLVTSAAQLAAHAVLLLRRFFIWLGSPTPPVAPAGR